jgi:6-phosphogluconolactonase
MTTLTGCPDAESVAVRAAAVVERDLARARDQRGVAHVGLSGGTTPARTYELLAAAGGDWADTQIWFIDERCVPPDDPESNYRLAADTLLERAAIPAAQVHRMEGELGPHEGASRYALALAEGIAARAGAMPVLDLAVLGVGPDGHVASLFPGAPSLDADERAICLGVEDSPKPPPRRITVSLGVLRAARSCLLLATGHGKADAVAAMLGDPSRHVPASLLRRERLTVIVDDAAAPPALR